MKLEDQVCSLELAKKLKELGVKQESLFSWLYIEKTKKWRLVASSEELEVRSFYVGKELISAFTVAELGEMLPLRYKTRKNLDAKGDIDGWVGVYWDGKANVEITENKSEANARAKCLIYLKEKGLVE